MAKTHSKGNPVFVAEMAFRETSAHLRKVLRNLPRAAAKHQADEQFVHHLRVESRRSAAALELYADFIPARQKEALERGLKKIRRAAGKARDLDVLIGLLKAEAAEKGSGALLTIARKQRGKAQRYLARAAKKAHDRGLERQVGRFLKEMGKRRSRVSPRFAPWARAALCSRLRAFLDAAPPKDPGLRQLHAFRIQTKTLRYTMEMLQPAFPPSFQTDLLRRVEDLQERLGALNDIAARKRQLSKWLSRTEDATAARRLRAHIALDRARLRDARAGFAAWCTPAFLHRLQADAASLLRELTALAKTG